ncbi:MAG: HEPN domain-containing protein [Pyrinomonadaceae bacterium]|nr:HEPN domain-containing protein [Pyrinomonadaceae bacterium]
MISPSHLREIARARLKDSEVLYTNGRYDGAVYLCGYAVEVALKARICKTLKWTEFPPKGSGDYRSFKVHDLAILLKFTGLEAKIKTKFFSDWSIVELWSSESRYNPVGTASPADAQNMIDSTRNLLKAVLL